MLTFFFYYFLTLFQHFFFRYHIWGVCNIFFGPTRPLLREEGGGLHILNWEKPLFLYSLFLFYLLQCTLLDFLPFSSLSSLPFLSCCHRKTTYGSGNVMHDNREMFSLWNETIWCNFLSFEYWNVEFFPIKDMQTPPPPLPPQKW